jgi:hypothetical protein
MAARQIIGSGAMLGDEPENYLTGRGLPQTRLRDLASRSFDGEADQGGAPTMQLAAQGYPQLTGSGPIGGPVAAAINAITAGPNTRARASLPIVGSVVMQRGPGDDVSARRLIGAAHGRLEPPGAGVSLTDVHPDLPFKVKSFPARIDVFNTPDGGLHYRIAPGLDMPGIKLAPGEYVISDPPSGSNR